MPIISYNDIPASPDYVIVGGGTAGIAIAARLSEDPDNTVLVIEAGASHGPVPEIDVPGYIGRLIANPKYDWTFLSTPQVHANNQVTLQPRGKGLGGSSMLNFMGMFRPDKNEIDALETDFGMKGWNWDSILNYMKKSETFVPNNLPDDIAQKYAARADLTFHGTTGPIQTSYGPTTTDLPVKLFDTAATLGVPRNPDTGTGVNYGCVSNVSSIDPATAKRSYSVSAYLVPNLHRENLLVLTDSHVTKIFLESNGQLQTAVGVEFVQNGIAHKLTQVKRDVIISCGTMQTPQILELSGIGNSDTLSKYGIKTLVDLPGVGENLQDHIGVCTVAEVETNDETLDILITPELIKEHEDFYANKKSGLFASVPPRAFVFVPADALLSKQGVETWKKQVEDHNTAILAKTLPALKIGLEKQYKVQKRLISNPRHPIAEYLQWAGRQAMPYIPPAEPGKSYTSLFCALQHPLSRGTVHIGSADPLMPPIIDPNYFSNPTDLELCVDILEYALKLYSTPPLGLQVKGPIAPSKETVAGGRTALAEYLKQNCGCVYHPVGTAAMLPREDGGVVDASLKVYGTSNLRIVDTSILPLGLSTHTQTMAYAIAEKAADILKAEATKV